MKVKKVNNKKKKRKVKIILTTTKKNIDKIYQKYIKKKHKIIRTKHH